MYLDFHGLRKNPFAMSPDPSLLYLTSRHREALAGLLHAVLNSKGMAVLTGDAGTGKTTLLRRVLRDLPEARVPSSIIFNPSLSPDELLEMALYEFGIHDIPTSKVQRLVRFRQFLLDSHAEGRIPLLAIDEAHTLSARLLEEIRLLSNFELADAKLLQIVLIGQNELCTVLDDVSLRQIKQRVAVRLSIEPLTVTEVESCIRFRWTRCGGSIFPFDASSVRAIAALSGGIPRLINSLCDNALLNAFGSGAPVVTVGHVQEAAADLKLKPVQLSIEDPKRQAEPLSQWETTPVAAPIRIFQTVTPPSRRWAFARRMKDQLLGA